MYHAWEDEGYTNLQNFSRKTLSEETSSATQVQVGV